MKCPHCGTEVGTGLTACRGCGAEVQYGATRKEISRAGFGFWFGSLAFTAIVLFLAGWIGLFTPRMADWLLFGNRGINMIVLLIVGVTALWFVDHAGRKWMKRRRQGDVRFFRHYQRR